MTDIETKSSAPASVARDPGFWIGAIATVLVLVVRLRQYWVYTVDDAYITFRFARNVIDGYGLAYNPGGDWVEGFSNPTLLVWQVLVLAVGGDVLLWTKVLGAVAALATVLGSVAIARELLLRGDALFRGASLALWSGPFVLAFGPGLATGAVSGLETALFGALLTWGSWAFLRLIHGCGCARTVAIAAACLVLATWTRPEGIAWSVGWAGAATVLTWRADVTTRRRAWIAGGIALGAWVVLIGLRLALFHQMSPNTYYAKMGAEPIGRIFSGLNYVRDWAVGEAGLGWLVIAAAGVFALPAARRSSALVALLAVIGHLLVVAWMGGDWIPHQRFTVPCLGVLAGLVSMGVVALSARVSGARLRAGAAAAGSALLAIALLVPGAGARERASREIQTRVYGWADGHKPLARWLADWQTRRGEPFLIAIEDIGIVGWFNPESPILDLAGLTDPAWAHEAYRTRMRGAYLVDRLLDEVEPDVIVLMAQFQVNNADGGIVWRTNREIYTDPRFLERYAYLATFTHKDFPGDGYFLHVFAKKRLAATAPPADPPVPRARG